MTQLQRFFSRRITAFYLLLAITMVAVFVSPKGAVASSARDFLKAEIVPNIGLGAVEATVAGLDQVGSSELGLAMNRFELIILPRAEGANPES